MFDIEKGRYYTMIGFAATTLLQAACALLSLLAGTKIGMGLIIFLGILSAAGLLFCAMGFFFMWRRDDERAAILHLVQAFCCGLAALAVACELHLFAAPMLAAVAGVAAFECAQNGERRNAVIVGSCGAALLLVGCILGYFLLGDLNIVLQIIFLIVYFVLAAATLAALCLVEREFDKMSM